MIASLEKYPAVHEQLDVLKVRGLIREWLGRLEAGDFERNPLGPDSVPKLALW